MNSLKKYKKSVRKHLVHAYNFCSPRYGDNINLVFWHGSKGLWNDAVILRRVLKESGFNVRFVRHKKEVPLPKCRMNIFLQYIYPEFLPYAKYNLFIPNPEWGNVGFEFINEYFDCVLAKTRDCERIFKKGTGNVRYTSFTSNDVYVEGKPARKYIHFAGKSPLKGTGAIIDLWNRNKKLPKLFLYSYDSSYAERIRTDNIVYQYQELSDEEVAQLQNSNLFHLNLSEYEGFGHQINESKSAAAVVFTTNASPMNELITNNFGFLVEARFKEHREMARLYAFVEEDLCEKIDRSRELTDKELEQKRMSARDSYLKNDLYFRERIKEIVDGFF